MLALAVEGIIAWSPFFSTLRTSATNSAPFIFGDDENYVSQLLTLAQSRRLSVLTKISVDLGLRISQGVVLDHIITSSRHGELAHTSELLMMIGKHEVLSPTLFAQSVHNTSAGSFSIIKKTNRPATSLSGGKDSFMMGLISSFIYLEENPKAQVLYISADTRVPQDFCIDLKETNIPFAVALLLKHRDSDSERRIAFTESMHKNLLENELSLPQTLDFLEWFFSQRLDGNVLGHRKMWKVSKC